MTTPMILVLAATVLMIILIVADELPFGVPSLLALPLMMVLGVMDIKTAFDGFSNSTIVMFISFMAIIIALQKTSLLLHLKEAMFNLAAHGDFRAHTLLILVVMLGCSLFGTGSTAYYVPVIGLLSSPPGSKALPPSRVLVPAGSTVSHLLLPFNMVLQYGTVTAVLQSIGISTNVDLVKLSLVNLCLSLGFLARCILAYRIMPDHPITDRKADESELEKRAILSEQKKTITYVNFVIAMVGMVLQSRIGDVGYTITALAVGVLLIAGVMDFGEIRGAINAPIILISAGVIGITDALGNISLTNLVRQTVTDTLGSSVNPSILIFAFCTLTSVLTTLTESTIGTVCVFAFIAVTTCVNLGPDSTAAAAAVVISGQCGHFLPIDSMPTMITGAGKYRISGFWKSTVLQYFIRPFMLTASTVILFPMKRGGL